MQYLTPDDGDVDPCFMWRASPETMPGKVGLDPVALDEGRYVIARVAPVGGDRDDKARYVRTVTYREGPSAFPSSTVLKTAG